MLQQPPWLTDKSIFAKICEVTPSIYRAISVA